MVEKTRMPTTPTARRRWFQFSLRALLVSVTLLAATFAFRASQVARQHRAVQRLVKAGAMVIYHDEGWGPFRGQGRVQSDESASSWLREFLGLRRPGEAYLGGPGITDQTIRDLVLPLRTLVWIDFTETSVSHEGLAQLSEMPDLKLVVLRSDARNHRITNELANPTLIDFHEIPLTDAVAYLADYHGIPIDIDQTQVPAELREGRIGLTGVFKNKPLDESLTELLSPSDLGWISSGGKLLITARSVQQQHKRILDQVHAQLPQVTEVVID